MRILVCTDKFKGSLSALEACKAIEAGIHHIQPTVDIQLMPMADGGEGSLKALGKVLDLKPQYLKVSGPTFQPIECTYTFCEGEAHIEMAQASGLNLLLKKDRNPLYTSTLGTGELMMHAIEKGAKKIHLWVGGSATNDGGIGLAEALGFRFIDFEGRQLSPIGKNLAKVETIEVPHEVSKIPIEIHTDVSNKLLGKQGAAQVFASQKGASSHDIELLDKGMENLLHVIRHQTGKDLESISGIGAAGGVGAVIMAYMNVSIQSGIESLLTLYQFKEHLTRADLVITGEGKIDAQTLHGKVVFGVAQKAQEAKVPVWAFCGQKDISHEQAKTIGLEKIASIQSLRKPVNDCIAHAYELLTQLTAQAIKSAETTFL